MYNTDKKELLCYNFISGGARMSERELDSSINDYIETETPKNYVKQKSGIWLLDFKKLIT